MKPLKLLVLPILVGLLCACGYKTLDVESVFGPNVSRIEIRIFENRSREPGFQALLGEALVEEFLRRGQLRPLYGNEEVPSDLVLEGAVVKVSVSPSAFSSVSLALEDTVVVVLDVEVRRSAASELVWEHSGLSMGQQFLASSDAQVYESNKEQALRQLSAALAGRIHDELFQKF